MLSCIDLCPDRVEPMQSKLHDHQKHCDKSTATVGPKPLKHSHRTRTTEQAFIQGPREASVTWNQSPTVKQEARISYEAVNSMAL